MKLKYYFVFSIIFLALIFIITYSITQESYDIGFGFSLPVALWVCLVVGVFFICSILFFFVFWAKIFVEKSIDNMDFDTLIKQIITKDYTSKIKNQNLAKLSRILQRYDLKPNLQSQESSHPKIDKIFKLLQNVKDGSYEEIEKYGFKEFNEINDKNYSLKSNKNALEILKDSSKSPEVRQFALHAICDSKKDKDIQKALEYAQDHEECISKNIVYKIIDIYDEARLDSTEIGKCCKSAGFESADYIRLAKKLQLILDPDKWMKFFADLANIDSKAQKAYLFTLLELEMISKALDEIKGDDGEFIEIRAYIDLKKAKKNYPLNIFI